MLGALALIMLCIVLMPLLTQIIGVTLFIALFAFVIPLITYFVTSWRTNNKVSKELDIMTSKKVLALLSLEDKKYLAHLVEQYRENDGLLKKEAKKSLLYFAGGYTVGDIGVDKAVRYGVGYVFIRNLLGKDVKDSMKK